MRPRPCLQAAICTNTHCDPQRELIKASQSLGQDPAYGSCHVNILLIPSRVRVFQWPRARALLWNPSFGGTPEADTRTPPFPQNDPKLLLGGGDKIHREGDSSMAHEANPTFHGHPSPKIRSLMPEEGSHTRPSFISEELPSWSVDRHCHSLGAKPKPRL